MDSRDDGDGVRHWSDSDADLPTWMRRTGKLVNLTGIANANHLLVGFFRDLAGQEYFMVVNKDLGKDMTGESLATDVLLSFHPSVQSLQRVGRNDGKTETLAVKNHQLAFRLPGGTGDLFKLDGSRAFAGIDAVAVPKLLASEPKTLCRLGGNTLQFTFDRHPGNITPVIRLLDASGQTGGADLAEHFNRAIGDDGKTLRLIEQGSHLRDKTRYRVELKWADAKPVEFQSLRGDVNGDGQVDANDINAFRLAKAGRDSSLADLNDDGRVDETDAALLRRILSPLHFTWKQDFDSFAADKLDGQGPWKSCEAIEGSLLSRSWIVGPAVVSADPARLIKGKQCLVAEGHPGEFVGSEARFLNQDGMGVVGTLKLKFLARVGMGSFHNHCVHLWSAGDTKGERGSMGCEITNSGVTVVSGRGVKLLSGPLSAELPQASDAVRDFEIVLEIDFGASTLTWSFTDCKTLKKQGPFTTPFTGKLADVNAVDVVLRGERGAIDEFVIEGYAPAAYANDVGVHILWKETVPCSALVWF